MEGGLQNLAPRSGTRTYPQWSDLAEELASDLLWGPNMMNRAVVAATLLALAAPALADDDAAPATQTTTVQTLVVITPNAPVVVNNSGQPQASTPQLSQLSPPGAPQAAPVADAAPHNEDWNNVSHINGSIVPVGERNAYLIAAKKNNIQSNPLAWIFGYYELAGQHALSQNIAVSVEVSGYSTDHQSGYSLAATLPIYFRRTFSGPFLEAGLVIQGDNGVNYGSCSDCAYGSTSSAATRTWAGPEVMFGWAWMFDSGLNVSAAFGAAKPISGSQMDSYSSAEPAPVGYFRVGYAF